MLKRSPNGSRCWITRSGGWHERCGMKQRVIELYYSVAELSFLLRFSDVTIRRRIKAGDFSPPDSATGQPDLSNIKDISGDIRVPASGVNWFLDRHPLRYDAGIKARNTAELRRKMHKEDLDG